MNDNELIEEFRTFTRYLIDSEAPKSLEARYVQAHTLGLVSTEYKDKKDERLVLAAQRGGLSTRMADVHARFFAAKGMLRQKMVLVLALLETHPIARRRADQRAATSMFGFAVKLTGWGLVSVGLLAASLIYLPGRRS